MVCEGCGVEALVMKTVRWRTGERRFVLCDPCHGPLADSLWVVAGVVPAHGKCRGCSHWFSVRELVEQKAGGKWDSPSGVCFSCSAV